MFGYYDEEREMELWKQDLLEEGREEGLQEGREEGREEGMLLSILKILNSGSISLSQAAEFAGMSAAEFEEKIGALA